MLRVIPSPTVGAWHIGPFALRGYALCILLGIAVAVWMTQRRLQARRGRPGVALDISAWAVPFGIVGGRLYHVITSPQAYFGKDGVPVDALKIWHGGMGIWGAVALGALGAWIGARRHGVRFLDFGDAAVPGIAVAQAIGRWGNWFNNEIYGSRSDLPWAVEIHQWDTIAGRAVTDADGKAIVLGTFAPTFLYEAIWCLVLAIALLWLDRHRDLARGQLLGLYVAGYPIGRIVIEKMRTDPANLILGQRLNVWTSIGVFLLGLAIFWWAGKRRQARGIRPDVETKVPTS